MLLSGLVRSRSLVNLRRMSTMTVEATLSHPSGFSVRIPTGLFINNKFVPSIAGGRFATVDPATGETITEVYEALKEDVDVAVVAAKAAAKGWAKVNPVKRAQLMFKLADLIQRDIDVLAKLEAWDNGKHVDDARNSDLPDVIGTLRYYAGWADKNGGKVIDVGSDFHAHTRHEPYGVVGQIIPWNYPLSMMGWKLGPALATGNTIVMKTSEKTPLSALKVCELIVEAGFPPGVVNVLSGFGPTAGDAIARHMDIAKVAFTGSTGVGRKIIAAAAQSNLKKVSLELGGKSAHIVFDDAKLESAVQAAVGGFTVNHGQNCCAGTRIFVQEGIYDFFVEKLKEATANLILGPQFEDGVTHGPLVDRLQFESVLGFIEHGKREGAVVALGGKRFGDKGFFVEPTIFTDVNDNMKIVREEIFGPVVIVTKFKTAEEVIERANDSPYGLAAGLHTTNLARAHMMSKALQAGTVWVNTYNYTFPQVPFGGYKQSGIGRELGEDGLKEYVQVKSVIMSLR